MAKFDSSKAVAHLQSKWGGRPCPMCGKGPWNIQDSTFQLAEFNEGNFVLGGPVIPVIPVMCNNCGYVALVNAIFAGVQERQKEAPATEKQHEEKSS